MGDKIKFVGGKILFVGGKICFNAECCCEAEPCYWCSEGTTPKWLEVTIAGIGPTDPVDCENCDDFNGRFVLDQVAGNPCNFRYDFSPQPCSGDNYIIVWLEWTGSMWRISANLYSGGQLIRWAKILALSTPYDCSTIDDDLPGEPGLFDQCVWTTSTCHVTAL